MESFKAFEAVAMQAGLDTGRMEPVDDEFGDDGDDWTCEFVHKQFFKELSPWVRSSPVANMVRFNVYSAIISNVKPKARLMLWGRQGDNSLRKIVKLRDGYARAIIEWRLEENQLWDKIVEEQRAILNKSDLYKVFGEAGRAGSAAILFKGDVLECVVRLCCQITGEKGTDGVFSNSPSPFTINILKLAKSRLGNKIETWMRKTIPSKLRAVLIMANVRGNDLSLPNLKLDIYNNMHLDRIVATSDKISIFVDQTYGISF